MPRSYVFLVHGVGLQEPGSWWTAWKDALIAALQQYDEFRALSAEDIERTHICFKPIGYDAVFETYRARWKELARDLAANDVVAGAQLDGLFAWVAEQDDAIKRAFGTHALDAVLWYGLPQARAAVQAKVARQLVGGLREMVEEGGTGAHLIAHSLGTSVSHDALVGLAGQRREDGAGLAHVRWKSVAMIANTSRLLRAWRALDGRVALSDYDPYRSALRPGAITDVYHTFRHQLDPITWLRRFDPRQRGPGYRAYITKHFADPKCVHDCAHYLDNPVVHVPVLRQIIGRDDLGEAQLDDVLAQYAKRCPLTKSNFFDALASMARDDGDAQLSVEQVGAYLARAFAVLT